GSTQGRAAGEAELAGPALDGHPFGQGEARVAGPVGRHADRSLEPPVGPRVDPSADAWTPRPARGEAAGEPWRGRPARSELRPGEREQRGAAAAAPGRLRYEHGRAALAHAQRGLRDEPAGAAFRRELAPD